MGRDVGEQMRIGGGGDVERGCQGSWSFSDSIVYVPLSVDH